VVLLAAAFALAYVSARLIAAMVAMPRQVHEYREARRRRKAHEAITGAVHEFFSGRYARAEKAAKAAMELDEQPGLAAMLAARAAHELRAYDRRDAYLAQGAAHLPANDIMKVITEADLLLEERRATDALAVLQSQPQKHTAGLRLELKALQLAGEWEKSLPVIDQLERRNVFDADQAATLRRHALAEYLKRCAADRAALDEAWRKVPDALRRDTIVAGASAQGYVALKAGARAAEIIERSLEQTWDSDLAGLYADCAGSDVVRQIERAERWLVTHSGDASLLLALGRLCARQELWGKAQNYLDASIAIEATYPAHLAAAQLHEKLGNAETAQRHVRAALDLALVKLAELRQRRA
jgi:HemY protein